MRKTVLAGAMAAALLGSPGSASLVFAADTAAAAPAAPTSTVAPAPSDPAGKREGLNGHAGDPEGVPSRKEMDRFVEQRRQEIDTQVRAMDPWGQARRDWIEGRRQFRRDTLDRFHGVPGMQGGYPWGPLAPYHGAPWGESMSATPRTREGMDQFFKEKHREMEEQFRQATPWSAYGGEMHPPGRDSSQDWMLRQNPWAPAP